MPHPLTPLPLPLEECLFHHGIALFNAQRYFLTHEAWEEIWRSLPPGPKKAFYHGLIQAAVALEHFRRRNPRGTLTLHRSATLKLRDLPSPFMGLDIPAFLADLHRAIAPLTNPELLADHAIIPPGPAHAPIITLLSDPFTTGEAAPLNPPA